MKLTPTDYGFYAGMFMTLAIHSFYQDYYGKEAYIKHISENWTSAYISVPLAIIFIIVAWILMGIGEHKALPLNKEIPNSKPTKETPNSKPTKENCLYCGGHGKVKNLDDKEMLCIACDGEKKVDTWS